MTKAAGGTRRFSGARKFLKEYWRYKLGVAGVVIIVFFTLMAFLAPFMTSYDPINAQNLATPYSVPSWARAFPQYSDYPVNSQILLGTSLSQSDLASWNVGTASHAGVYVTSAPVSGGLMVNFTEPHGGGAAAPSLYLNQTVDYPWTYACRYISTISVTPMSQALTSGALTFDIYIKSVGGKVYHVLGPEMYNNPADSFSYVGTLAQGKATRLVVDSADTYSNLLATGKVTPTNLGPCGLAEGIFTKEGHVTVSYKFTSAASGLVLLASPTLRIQGRAFGLLGTDNLGRDVWSQFVYGSRVSLEVGLVAAVIAVLLGTLVGVVAGYRGGLVDEGLMRFTDFLLILPFLPLLLIIIIVMSVGNVAFPLGTEFLIIVFIAVFSWQGIARVIRAQVLSLKERQFVEASKALGANDGHVIWDHILPNVTGLIYANLALTVPGAILTEAAITFLGFGAPNVISWGTMVSDAQAAVTSTLHSFVWWWFLPPGLAIALLSMAFLFVGFSLDNVLNPRLRRR